MSKKHNLEMNKLAASVLVAGIIAMVAGFVTDALYKPNLHPEKRGFQVEATDETASTATASAAPEKIAFDVATLMAGANLEAGKAEVKKCAACHDFEKGGANKVGPNLWGIVGAAKAHHAGYTYSDALKGKGGNWEYDDIFHFIHNPKQFVPGTKMGFAGIKKPEDIANIVAYLRSLSDSPVALPKK